MVVKCCYVYNAIEQNSLTLSKDNFFFWSFSETPSLITAHLPGLSKRESARSPEVFHLFYSFSTVTPFSFLFFVFFAVVCQWILFMRTFSHLCVLLFKSSFLSSNSKASPNLPGGQTYATFSLFCVLNLHKTLPRASLLRLTRDLNMPSSGILCNSTILKHHAV